MPNDLSIAVLGDSVAWGQGLQPQNKYAQLVANVQASASGSTFFMAAHSGAIIGAGYNGDHDTAHPEVPLDTPTIIEQCTLVPNPANVDLVLINGGINDVNIRVILNPLTSKSVLRRRTTKACLTGMKQLLAQAAATFTKPGCRFVVSGYYPILSPASDFELFDDTDLLEHLLGWHGLGFPIVLERAPVIEHVVKLCMQFWRESDAALARATNESASLLGLGNRLMFVPAGFKEANALFAPAQWLWGFNARLEPEDEVIPDRKTGCKLHYDQPWQLLEREVCGYASLGHPNLAGSRQIAATILAAV